MRKRANSLSWFAVCQIPVLFCDSLPDLLRSEDIGIASRLSGRTLGPHWSLSFAPFRESLTPGHFQRRANLQEIGDGPPPFQGKGMLGCFRRGPELGGSPPP